MRKIIYKIPNGKLLRIKVGIDNSEIEKITINGDFFIHPEEAVIEIENFLSGKKIDSIDKELTKFLKDKDIRVIGFSPADLFRALS